MLIAKIVNRAIFCGCFVFLAACGSGNPNVAMMNPPADAGRDLGADASSMDAATTQADSGVWLLQDMSTDVTVPCADDGGSTDVTWACTPGATLQGLRWDLPCSSDPGTGSGCTASGGDVSTMETVAGDVHTTYQVTLRFRGIIEQESYTGGTLTAGTTFLTGGTPAHDGYNIYQLTVTRPASTDIYYLNAGTSFLCCCMPIDYTVTIPMEGTSTVLLYATTADGAEKTNRDTSGTLITIPGVPGPMGMYGGQFVQMDVVNVTE